MKKIRFGLFIFTLIAVLGISAFAKTHSEELISVDKLEYTLEEEDKLSAVLLIDEDGICSVKITDLSTSGSSKPKISVTVYDGNNKIYFFETDKTPFFPEHEEEPEAYEFMLGLTQGEYKLVVENLTMFSDVSFKLETSFSETEYIETSNNTSFDFATKMDFKTKYSGGVSMLGESDYYSFEMPYDGYAFIEMYSPSLKYFILYDEFGNEVGSVGINISEKDKVYSIRSGLAKGKYYIEVTADENYISPLYTLEVIPYEGQGFEKEFNNEKEYADAIEFGKEYQGNMFGYDDKDVYSFTLHDNSGIVIDFTDMLVSKENHYSITLSDGQNDIYTSNECGKKTVAENLSKGTYYFTVESLGSKNYTNTAYSVRITADNRLAICPPEEEDTGSIENEPVKEEAFRFDDVDENSWYYSDIMEAYREGLVEGVPTTDEYDGFLYSPDVGVSVAEAITMAVRAHSKKYGIEYEYVSSNGMKWYSFYVDYAKKHGIIKEDFDDYSRKATRAEVAYLFANLFDETETGKNTIIPDVDENTKYCDSIHKLYALDILKGDDENGTFYPERNLTRAEAAVILLRIHKA